MKARRVFVPLVIFGVLGFGGWYVEVRRAKARSVLSGFFESQPATLASRISGRVTEILVQEGEEVRAGQPLLRLEARTLEADLQAKRAQVEQAFRGLEELRAGTREEVLRRQEQAVAEAEALLEKLRNGPQPEEIDRARFLERQAAARVHALQRGATVEEKEQLRARFRATLAQERLAKEDYERSGRLFREGALSNSQHDAAKVNLEAATADREAAEQVLKRAESGTPEEELDEARAAHKAADASLRLLLSGTRREDIAAAEARLKQARAILDELRNGARFETIATARAATRASVAQKLSLERLIAESTVYAPRRGIVERVLVAEGDLLQPGAPAIRLSNPTDIWLRVVIPEGSLAKVRVGDEAELRIDGINGSLPAIVEAIASQGEFTPANLQTPNERAKQVFAVKLRLAKPDTRVKAGMYATVKRMGRWP